jgi:hypothetical protein
MKRSATPPLVHVSQNTGCPLKKAVVSEGGRDKKTRIVNLDQDGLSKKPGGNSIDNLCALFLTHLLRPREWNAQQDGGGIFSFRREHIISLCEACLDVLANQPMIIHV